MLITGCAYYPEHWSPERWAQDAAIMREAGLTVVRVGEFAWDKFEPQEGVYDFAWMDEAVSHLQNAGLQVIMCTPTPTPPPWLTHKHPDICRVNEMGIRISPGGRRHACANVPAYLEYSRKITEKMVEHYGDHPAIVGWQIDNEFGCGETTRCYCDHCRARFHQWLAEKYGSLDALNVAWGTQFWGMTYRDWQHIPIPGITTEPQSPAMRLDYRRFSSDSWVRFQKMQIDILRPQSLGRWMTHNFMIRHWSLDYWELAKDIDFVSYDNYPHGMRGAAETSMNHDIMRSLKGKPFWVMEQQPGRVNWHPYNPPVPDGQVRVWSHQAVAHGAESIVYFRYRAGRFGQEQYHGGLLKWDGTKDQCFDEAQQVAQEFEKLPHLSRPKAKVGIIFDYNDLWAIELEPHHKDFSYWELVYELYAPFWAANIPVDFLPRNADLTGYEQVIVPAAFLIHPGEVEKWQKWVEAGGQLLVTFRSGYRELGSISTELTLPGSWTDLIGAKIKRFVSSPPDTYTDWADHRAGKRVNAVDRSRSLGFKYWAETLEAASAQPLFTYGDGMFAGQTAAVVREVGKGKVWYLGCWLEEMSQFLHNQGWITAKTAALQKVELQGGDGSRWEVTLNHRNQKVDNLDPLDVRYTKV